MKLSSSLITFALATCRVSFVNADDNANNPFAPDPNLSVPVPPGTICRPEDASSIDTGVSCRSRAEGVTCRFGNRDCNCRDGSWTCGPMSSTPVVPTSPPTMPPPTCDGTPLDCSGEVVILKDQNETEVEDIEVKDDEEASSAVIPRKMSLILAVGAIVALL